MELKQLLEQRLDRRLRPPTPSKQNEVWYRDQLTAFIKMLQDQLIEEISRIPLNDTPDTPPISITARFSAAIQRLAEWKVSDLSRRLRLGMVNRANTQNKRQTRSVYKSAFGIDLSGLLGDEPIKTQMQEAIADNVALIKSIHTDFINDVGGVIFGNLAKGGRHENLVSLITERGKVTESRARLIARDKTAKPANTQPQPSTPTMAEKRGKSAQVMPLWDIRARTISVNVSPCRSCSGTRTKSRQAHAFYPAPC